MATNEKGIEKDIDKAARYLRENRSRYTETENYYDGDQDLAFASDKFKNAFGSLFREFSLNLCPAVVDAVKDKLVITGFRAESGGENIPEDAWKIWQQNRMGKRSGEIHKEAVKNGDAYAIVWPDPTGRVTIYPQRAGMCMVEYDEETPGRIVWAAKYWRRLDDRHRVNMFYGDRVEKYISRPERSATRDARPDPETIKYEPFTEDKGGEVIPNPYGVVPVFHFANNADLGSLGRSELKDVISVQDALNKSVLDMLVAMEFSAFRQRWISGIEIEYDNEGQPIAPFKSGAERLWITESAETKFGDFAASELSQFLGVKDSFRIDFASVSGTPLYYFMQTGANFPQSGESYRRAETRFVNKIRDRQEAFGNVWEDLMQFALRMDGKGNDVRLYAEWEDAAKLSETEELANLLVKKDLGVSDEQLLTEAGYGAADIKAMLKAKAEQREAMVRSFNRGEEEDDDGSDMG